MHQTDVTIAVLSPGAMGSAVAARLVENGARVLTSLQGRSEGSAARARASGMIDAADAEIAGADVILSIVPPGEAEALAQRLLPWLAAAPRKPLYVDANALSPASKRSLAARFDAAGCPMLDGAIIGAPPTQGARGPALYVSGPDASCVTVLAERGLDLRVMDGPLGAASALKMSYAGINKGLVGLGAAMLLGAARAGAADALRAEMASSAPDLLARFERQIPDMYPKAYRWVAEMRQIAAFLQEDEAAATIFEGMARLFERLAADVDGEGRERALLDDGLQA